MSYLAHISLILLIYIGLSVSLDLLVGNLGLLILCQSAFFAVGAYASALLLLNTGLPFLIVLPLVLVITSISSFPIAVAVRRLNADAVVLASFAFLLLMLDLLKNLKSITGGLVGLSDIPAADIFGIRITSTTSYALLALVLVSFIFFVVSRTRSSTFGMSARALRDDLYSAVGLGLRPLPVYLLSFALCAGLAGLMGAVYATYASYVSPSTFDMDSSILLLCMVFIGGASTRLGPILGAVLLICVPELVRILGGTGMQVGAINYITFGLLLVLFAILRPRGIMGGYVFN